jgi:hypothetical protein
LGIVLVVDQNAIPLTLDKETPHDDHTEYTFKLARPFEFSGNGEEFWASFRIDGDLFGDECPFTDTNCENRFEWGKIELKGLTENDTGIWQRKEGEELKVVYIAKDAEWGYGNRVTATVQVRKPKALDGWNNEMFTEYENSVVDVMEEYAGLILGAEPTTEHTWKGKDPRDALRGADGEVESLTVTVKVIK